MSTSASKYIDIIFSTPFKKFTLYITRPAEYDMFYDVVIAGSIFGLWNFRRKRKRGDNIIYSSVLMEKPCMVLDTFDTLTDAREYVENLLDEVS